MSLKKPNELSLNKVGETSYSRCVQPLFCGGLATAWRQLIYIVVLRRSSMLESTLSTPTFGLEFTRSLYPQPSEWNPLE